MYNELLVLVLAIHVTIIVSSSGIVPKNALCVYELLQFSQEEEVNHRAIEDPGFYYGLQYSGNQLM